MHLTYRNVNDAFRGLVGMFADTEEGPQRGDIVIRRPSRNGNVLMINEPVTITYTHPRERVLFNAARDANPFFHIYEALWMLAGRNDVDSVAYYAKQMREYSDDGKILNGAYGYRWRHTATHPVTIGAKEVPDFANPSNSAGDKLGPLPTVKSVTTVKIDLEEVDQLDLLAAHLKADPNSRRAVLQMWNVEDDLLNIGKINALPGLEDRSDNGSKDVCCNLSVMLSIRDNTLKAANCPGAVECKHGYDVCPICDRYLDMTVTNRSNDLIWGLLGANYVHFTILQEYMAARLGVEVGLYHHFTNNLHVYDWNWNPEEWLADKGVGNRENDAYLLQMKYGYTDGREEYKPVPLNLVPLVKDSMAFEQEVKEFAEWHKNGELGLREGGPFRQWQEPFLADVADPALLAYHSYKRRAATTVMWAQRIKADDWRIACTAWLERHLARKQNAPVSE